MSSSQFEKSVTRPPLSNDGRALIVLCFTFLLSVSANIYQFLVSCQDAVTIASLTNTVQAKTNKINSLQEQEVVSFQPDAISAASDGDPPSIVADQHLDFNYEVLDCAERPEVLLLSPFVLGTKFYTLQTWESLRLGVENNVCTSTDPTPYYFVSSRHKVVWNIAFQTCLVLAQDRPFSLRGPY